MDKEVKIRICFLLIGDIDTKAQRFVAEVLIEATWEVQSDGDKSSEKNFDPKLVITNLEESRKETKWYTRCFDHLTDSNWVTLHWRMKGVFYENMELQNFPRDVQDISVSVSSDWHANEIELMLDYSKMSTLDVANFRDDQEWTLFRHVELERIPEETNKDIELGYTAGFVIARCRVARRAKFFMVNNVMMMFSLVVLSLTIFAYDPAWNMARIGSSMTLLLVAVAFKLSMAGNLPLISYLTYLDIYILSGMLYLCAITIIFTAISPFKNDLSAAKHIDSITLIILVVCIVSFHVVYGLVFWINTNKRINEMLKKDKEYAIEISRHREMQCLMASTSTNMHSLASSSKSTNQECLRVQENKLHLQNISKRSVEPDRSISEEFVGKYDVEKLQNHSSNV